MRLADGYHKDGGGGVPVHHGMRRRTGSGVDGGEVAARLKTNRGLDAFFHPLVRKSSDVAIGRESSDLLTWRMDGRGSLRPSKRRHAIGSLHEPINHNVFSPPTRPMGWWIPVAACLVCSKSAHLRRLST